MKPCKHLVFGLMLALWGAALGTVAQDSSPAAATNAPAGEPAAASPTNLTSATVVAPTNTAAAPAPSLAEGGPGLRNLRDNSPGFDRRNHRANARAEAAPAAGRMGSAATNDYPAFEVIYDRNIFNPNRRPHPKGTPADEPPPVRVETFNLVGTQLSEEGVYAYFVGSDARYNKVMTPGESIGGLKILEIIPDCVRLNLATNKPPLELPVGGQMRRQDEGEWRLVGIPSISLAEFGSSGGGESDGASDDVIKRLMSRREKETATQAAATPRNATIMPDPPTPARQTAGADAGSDDVIKRLMQKREQELNK